VAVGITRLPIGIAMIAMRKMTVAMMENCIFIAVGYPVIEYLPLSYDKNSQKDSRSMSSNSSPCSGYTHVVGLMFADSADEKRAALSGLGITFGSNFDV
jgi:hypothetical protein